MPGESSEPFLWVVRPLRDRGKRIPRYVWYAGEEQPPKGRLEVTWEHSAQHHRQLHVARLISADAREVIPSIRDAHILVLSRGDLTLAGIEMIGDVEYAQTWFCRLLRPGWGPRGKPEDPTGRSGD